LLKGHSREIPRGLNGWRRQAGLPRRNGF
jgi:hypothetical protein